MGLFQNENFANFDNSVGSDLIRKTFQKEYRLGFSVADFDK